MTRLSNNNGCFRDSYITYKCIFGVRYEVVKMSALVNETIFEAERCPYQ